MKDICYECGESVAFGSGKYTNRIPSFNDEETRRADGAKFPKGEFLCAECDAELEEALKSILKK